MPVLQNGKIFGVIPCNHWTLMEIKKDADNQIIATHYDSKGWFSKIYSLSGIKRAVQSVLPDVHFEASYHGHQGLLNFTDCGRYVLSYIKQKANGEATLTAPRDFEQMDQEIENMPNIVEPQQQPEVPVQPIVEEAPNQQPGAWLQYVNNQPNIGQGQVL